MQGQVRAPEINQPGLDWLNVDAPLSLADVAGKLVILDFWTFCCINCMHILPTLARLEEAFPEELAVIGVHSPKFAAEKDLDNIRHAIARYDIRHPIAHDPGMVLWQQFAVRAWPTLVVIAPDGSVMGQIPGEPDPDKLHDFVADLLNQARDQGHLQPSPMNLSLEVGSPGRFAFPAKMCPIPGTDNWALADSGHHQIAILDGDGQEVRRIGSGTKGFDDGDGASATFNSPQGVTSDGQSIFVADTYNHALRRIDLADDSVTTLAGNGRRGPVLERPLPAPDAVLASPWDVLVDGDQLYFANAGTHQLGVYGLADGRVSLLAGNGHENIVDGPAQRAQLAQPSGLALSEDGETLYFADSETSALRALSLGDRQVSTLIGTGLFDFGHINGPADQARLQHALGIAVDGDNLIIADSYNGILRQFDGMKNAVSDLDDGSFTCLDDICIPGAEPAGVSMMPDGRILMVDTNNHRIVAYRPEDKTYATWAS